MAMYTGHESITLIFMQYTKRTSTALISHLCLQTGTIRTRNGDGIGEAQDAPAAAAAAFFFFLSSTNSMLSAGMSL